MKKLLNTFQVFKSMEGDRDSATTKINVGVFSSHDDLRSVTSERASSTSIQDIPEELLVEILCRLPCAKYVFRCKSVSKSWLSLTSDPSFIGRFLWLQRHYQTPIPGTIINKKMKELLTTDLFARFARFIEEENLQVVATWNDLVLCKIFSKFKDDGPYYICNPRTMQLVSLPPNPARQCIWRYVAVGFICEPYYKEEEEDDDRHANNTDQKGEKREVIRIDAEYKFKVVRILPPDPKDDKKICFEFKIEVYCSEIGEWRESLVSCPHGFIYSRLLYATLVRPIGAFASNGMLYWTAKDGGLLGLGPSMNNNKSTPTCSNSVTANTDPVYKFHVIKLVNRQEHGDDLCTSSYHLQAHRGRLQLVQPVANEDSVGAKLFVWELEKEELEQMAVQGGGELVQRHQKIYVIMEKVECFKYRRMEYLGSDPNDLKTCYVSVLKGYKVEYDLVDNVIYKCNLHTGQCSEMEMDENHNLFFGRALQYMLPWWPTPVPTSSVRSHAENRNI